jgi:hypothetical protein
VALIYFSLLWLKNNKWLESVDSTGITGRFHRNDNSAARVPALSILRSRADATAPASGMGVSMDFQLEGFTNNSVVSAAQIETYWDNNQTNDTTSRNSALMFRTMDQGTLYDALAIAPSGAVAIKTYPFGTNRLDVNGGAAFGTYGGAASAPSNGLIVSGNVGVGTTSPTAKLHVEHATTATTSFTGAQTDIYPSPSAASTGVYKAQQNYVGGGGANNITGGLYGVSNIVNWGSSATLSESIATLSKIENGTNGIMTSGIGTFTEVENVSTGTISNSIGSRIVVRNTSTGTTTSAYGADIQILRNAGTITNAYGLYIGSIQGTNKYSIYASDFQAANFIAGHLGLGVNSAAYKLNVLDTVATDAVTKFSNSDTSNTADGIIVKVNASTLGTGNDFIQFQKNGDTVIGQIEANSNTSVAYTTTSDRRLKENIVDSHFNLNDLLKIKVQDYNYIGDNRPMNGFIAQDLYEVYPQAVSKPEDEDKGYWGVDYGKITPLIVKAIQDLYKKWFDDSQKIHREISSLKEENAQIKSENQMMKDYLCQKDPAAPFCQKK